MNSEVQGMTDNQFKSFLKDLLAFVLEAETLQDVIKHLEELIRDYQ